VHRAPREEELLELIHGIRGLQAEIAQVKDERNRVHAEMGTLWTKLAQVPATCRASRPARGACAKPNARAERAHP
jgi:hypothetical protein